MRRLRFIGLVAAFMLVMATFQPAYSAQLLQQEIPKPDPDFVEMPKGVSLPLILIEKVSTGTAQLGQPVMCAVAQDIFVGTRKVLTRADRVTGHVTRVERPVFGRNGILQIEFDNLRTAAGLSMTIDSFTNTGQDGHYWGGEITDGTVPEIIPYRVWRVGTYGRVLMQGPRVMGKEVSFNPGTRMVIVLEQPVTLIGE